MMLFRNFTANGQHRPNCAFALVLLASTGCTSQGDYSSGSPAVLVQPTRMFWINDAGNEDGLSDASSACDRELRTNPDYLALLKEGADLARRPSNQKAPADKKRAREIARRRGEIVTACMLRAGFRHIPKGVPLKR